MSKIRFPLIDSAIPLFCNTNQDKLCLSLDTVSETNACRVSLYEHDGVYWYCLEYDTPINSIGFSSLRNCVSSLRDTLKSLGFVLCDPCALLDFVRRWEHSLKLSSFRKGVS